MSAPLPLKPTAAQRLNAFLSEPLSPTSTVGTARGGEGVAAGRPAAAPLSPEHIPPQAVPDQPKSPSVSYARNGESVFVHIPGAPPPGAARRGIITGFSRASRRRLLHLVRSVDQTAATPRSFVFVTLTYHRNPPTAAGAKRDLEAFIKRFFREYGTLGLIWKIEPQRRGAPHFHLLVYFPGADAAAVNVWTANAWHAIAGHGSPNHLKFHLGQLGNRPCVETVNDWAGVGRYAAKYMGKVGDDDVEFPFPGRCWGTRNVDLLPITRVAIDLPPRAAAVLVRGLRRRRERERPQRFYVPGRRLSNGRDLPGQVLPGSRKFSVGGVERPLREVVAEVSEMLGVRIRPQRPGRIRLTRAERRAKRRADGPQPPRGLSGFVPSDVVECLLPWAIKLSRSAMVATATRTDCHPLPVCRVGTAIWPGDDGGGRRRAGRRV